MIQVVINVRHLPVEKRVKWRELKKKARQARDEVIQVYENWLEARRRDPKTPDFQPEFQDEIWREIRNWLLENVFYGKCAYCETPAVGFRPHSEHYRPKAQVRFKNLGQESYQTGKTLSEEGSEIDHPGYFWLAYNWKNLLPACQYCNAFDGKKDQFPAKNQYVMVRRFTTEEVSKLKVRRLRRKSCGDVFYLEPEDLNVMEEPLLLSPYFDDPRQHLVFGADGKVVPYRDSEKGKHSIAVFDLNSKDRVKARHRVQSAAFNSYLKKMDSTKDTPLEIRRAGEEALAEYRKGEAPYCAAALDFIHIMTRNSPMDPYITLEDVAKMEDDEIERAGRGD